jgi:hypothetical protein
MGMHRHSSYAPAKTSPLFWERHREPISNVINSKQASKQANGRDPCQPGPGFSAGSGSGSEEPSPTLV